MTFFVKVAFVLSDRFIPRKTHSCRIFADIIPAWRTALLQQQGLRKHIQHILNLRQFILAFKSEAVEHVQHRIGKTTYLVYETWPTRTHRKHLTDTAGFETAWHQVFR